MVIVDKYNAIVGSAVVILSAIFGQFWYLFALYAGLQIFDMFTGWYKARKLHLETSRAGSDGLLKKLGYWVIVLVAFMIPAAFIELGNHILGMNLSFLEYLGWFALASLIINETRSILENLVEAGYHVPNILVKGLAVTERLINSKINQAIPEPDEESTKQ